MEYAILVDPAKCTGCRNCEVACKGCNDLSFNTYTTLRFKIVKNGNGDTEWISFNWRCMHCKIPACAEACPVNAITKYGEGPVVVDQDRCIGCRFCVSACPFDIPKFDPVSEKVYKCHMCSDRIPAKEPACVKVCPTGALVFGTRDTILQKAIERKEELKDDYQIIDFAFSFGSFTAVKMKFGINSLGTNIITRQPLFGSINYVFHYAQDKNFILIEEDIPVNSSFEIWISEPQEFLDIGAGFNGNSYDYYHPVEFKEQYDILIYWDTTTASELLIKQTNQCCRDIFVPYFGINSYSFFCK